MSISAYRQLVALAEEELELARAGRLEEVEALQARRARHVAQMPSYPPPDARASLERAAALQRETTVVLATSARQAAESLRKVDRGRAVARSYAPGGAEPARTRTLDRSA